MRPANIGRAVLQGQSSEPLVSWSHQGSLISQRDALDFPAQKPFNYSMNITNLSAQQLRQAASLKDQIQSLENQLAKILGSSTPATPTPATSPKPAKKKGKMSAAGRANIIAAQKARWAKIKETAKPARKAKKKMSAAAKARLSALAKARWAKAKKAGKTKL
jgi:hypothetical protein